MAQGALNSIGTAILTSLSPEPDRLFPGQLTATGPAVLTPIPNLIGMNEILTPTITGPRKILGSCGYPAGDHGVTGK